MAFNVGDRVKISAASRYYDRGEPSNPRDVEGTVVETQRQGLPLLVGWDNNSYNSYAEHDLILCKAANNYIPFPARRKSNV